MARVLVVLTFVLASVGARADGPRAVDAPPPRAVLEIVAPGLVAVPDSGEHDLADDPYPARAPAPPVLDLAACVRDFDGVAGLDVVRCYGPDGALRADLPAAGAEAALGLDAPRLDALVRAGAACARRGPLRAVDRGLGIEPLLVVGRVPAEVCLDVEVRAATFEVDGGRVRYSARRAPGGGNARGTAWSIEVERAALAVLDVAHHPLLACESYDAGVYCGWRLHVRAGPERVTIEADDIAPPCKLDYAWEAVLRALDSAGGCGAHEGASAP